MTDRKISELVAVTTVEDTDEFVLARAGVSNKITGENLLGAGGAVLVATKHLTAAMLLDIFNTPVEVVPPPGATSVLNLLSAVAVFHEGTTPYTWAVEGLIIEARQSETFPNSLVTAGEDRYASVIFATISAATVNDLDVPATVYSSTDNPADGDGTMDITVYYTIVDTTSLA